MFSDTVDKMNSELLVTYIGANNLVKPDGSLLHNYRGVAKSIRSLYTHNKRLGLCLGPFHRSRWIRSHYIEANTGVSIIVVARIGPPDATHPIYGIPPSTWVRVCESIRNFFCRRSCRMFLS